MSKKNKKKKNNRRNNTNLYLQTKNKSPIQMSISLESVEFKPDKNSKLTTTEQKESADEKFLDYMVDKAIEIESNLLKDTYRYELKVSYGIKETELDLLENPLTIDKIEPVILQAKLYLIENQKYQTLEELKKESFLVAILHLLDFLPDCDIPTMLQIIKFQQYIAIFSEEFVEFVNQKLNWKTNSYFEIDNKIDTINEYQRIEYGKKFFKELENLISVNVKNNPFKVFFKDNNQNKNKN